MENSDRLEELLLTAKLRACGGTVFWFCCRSDRERIVLFHRTVQAAGRRGRDGREVCSDVEPEELTEHFDTNALLVFPDMRDYLERYLNACPPDARHLLVYSRRFNGPSPINSVFMELWWNHGVEVWELGALWWLLDFETSGLSREKDSIIALFLARLEDWKTAEEQTVLIRPDKPLEPWTENLTGISNLELEQAMPLGDGLIELERVRDRFLILDQRFILPFLENFCRRCGEKFSRCFLTLDCLLEQLGIPAKQKVGKLLEAFPPPPESWPDVPPENVYLAERYQLTRALLYQLEETE